MGNDHTTPSATMDDTPNPTVKETLPIPIHDEATEQRPANQQQSPPPPPSSPLQKSVHDGTTQPQPDLATSLRSFTDKALDFLAHASNETLGACLVGLGATTYIALGRVGLVLIGVAGGVVLHATWDGVRGDTRDEATKEAEKERRREAGVEVVKRVLEWRATAESDEKTDKVTVYGNQALDYSSFGPEAAAALDAFTTAVIKDYVYNWYAATIPGEESFPATCRRTFTAFILSLSGHLQRKRAADAFLDFVSNASSIIIVFLNELAIALNSSPNATAEEAIGAYLKMKPDSSLAYMLDQKSQEAKLVDAAEDILQAYLDPKAYNCPPVQVFLKEVLAQLVLGYTLQKCSEPDWINGWIVYGLEESETAKEVMNIVDAGVEGSGKATKSKHARNEGPRGKDVTESPTIDSGRHNRTKSRAAEAMDEAMQEARRLTDLMIAEDERRRETQAPEGQATPAHAGDGSDGNHTHGAPTPTSSQSDRERVSEDTKSVTGISVVTDQGSGPNHRSTPSAQFTSFDQILPKAQPSALSDSPISEKSERKNIPVLTLHNANVVIFDDGEDERALIKAKPNIDFLIQIEPASSAFPGWMIARKYQDFQMLHEVLRRISVITGARFNESHNELPKWKGNTKASLRSELERYLTDAIQFQTLAESEGMKRFLEKDQVLARSTSGTSKGFGWPTPDAFGKFGGDVMNVLTKAPKQVAGGVTTGGRTVIGGVAGGGKAVFGGVAGLVGAGKRANRSQASLTRIATGDEVSNSSPDKPRPSMQLPNQPVMTDGYLGSIDVARKSQDSLRMPLERSTSSFSTLSESMSSPISRTQSASRPESRAHSRPSSMISQYETGQTASPSTSTPQFSADEAFNLPPPPSEMPADYGSPSRKSSEIRALDLNKGQSQDVETENADTPRCPSTNVESKRDPLNEREASVAIELMFAVIQELYTLSGAWQIRKTLLTAAKTFLLRPGNPQLVSIRDMLQDSLLDANLSDAGLAHQIYKLRENALPTPEEVEIAARDHPEKTAEQKEALRLKARALLVTRGMPQALTSVMGAAASSVALGKVFDCLQVPEVSRGLVFGLILQALRVVTR
jgi:hypothetical protein